jgi:hypothetical protein
MIDVKSNGPSRRHRVYTDGLITYENVLKAGLQSDGIERNKTRTGKVLMESRSKSLLDCKIDCQKRKHCKSYNFNLQNNWIGGKLVEDGKCHLFDHIFGGMPSVYGSTGVLQDKYTCVSY